jgi:hypothetical protein
LAGWLTAVPALAEVGDRASEDAVRDDEVRGAIEVAGQHAARSVTDSRSSRTAERVVKAREEEKNFEKVSAKNTTHAAQHQLTPVHLSSDILEPRTAPTI